MTHSAILIAQSIAARLLGQPDALGDRKLAHEHLDAFSKSQSRDGRWTSIKKPAFCERIGELIDKPFLLNQQGSGFCQSVAPLYVWALCYPARFCAFAVSIYETGNGAFGDVSINMQSGLITGDLDKLNKKWHMDLTDMMLILAIRDYQNNFFDIDDIDDNYAYAIGVTVEIEEPIEDSDLFQITKFESTVAGFQALDTEKPSFVITEGSMALFSTLAGFHAAVLQPNIKVTDGIVTFQFWSWGDTASNKVPSPSASGWRQQTASTAGFGGLGEAYHVIPNRSDIIP